MSPTPLLHNDDSPSSLYSRFLAHNGVAGELRSHVCRRCIAVIRTLPCAHTLAALPTDGAMCCNDVSAREANEKNILGNLSADESDRAVRRAPASTLVHFSNHKRGRKRRPRRTLGRDGTEQAEGHRRQVRARRNEQRVSPTGARQRRLGAVNWSEPEEGDDNADVC